MGIRVFRCCTCSASTFFWFCGQGGRLSLVEASARLFALTSLEYRPALYHIAVHCHCSLLFFFSFSTFWGFGGNLHLRFTNETSHQRQSFTSQSPGGDDWGGTHRAFYFWPRLRILRKRLAPSRRNNGPLLFYTQACLGFFSRTSVHLLLETTFFSKRLFFPMR